jgi:hypothetical protein
LTTNRWSTTTLSGVLVGEVVGQGAFVAEQLKTGLVLGAGASGIDHASDRGEVAELESGDGRANFGDAADDSWPGRQG